MFRLPQSRSANARRRISNRSILKPITEMLEQRLVLSSASSSVTWNGLGGDFDWNNALNWSTHAVPTGSDNVIIDLGTNNFTVTHASNIADSVKSLIDRASLNVSNGTLTVAGTSEIDGIFTLAGGTLTNNGNLAIANEFDWQAGVLSGSGTTTVGLGGTLQFESNNSHTLVGSQLTNLGSAIWTGGYIDLLDHGVFVNRGTFSAQNPGYFLYNHNGSGGEFDNFGDVNVPLVGTGGGMAIGSYLTFNNMGSVEVQSGVFSIVVAEA